MHPILQRRHREIEDTILTKEEEALAIWEGKIAKWNEVRNREYWTEDEKIKQDESKEFPKNKTNAPTNKAIKDILQKRVKKRWGKAQTLQKSKR